MPKRSFKILTLLEEYGITATLGAEVGVQFGKNADVLLRKLPDLHLLLVDNYDDEAVIHANYSTKEVADHAFYRLDKYKGRIQWLVMPSVEAAKSVDDKSLDYAFIDAEHTYKAVKQDVEAWLPKVKTGGLLIGHDYTRRFKGVKQAVQERFGANLKRDSMFVRFGDVWYVEVTEGIR